VRMVRPGRESGGGGETLDLSALSLSLSRSIEWVSIVSIAAEVARYLEQHGVRPRIGAYFGHPLENDFEWFFVVGTENRHGATYRSSVGVSLTMHIRNQLLALAVVI
jgi:hypothetical protein